MLTALRSRRRSPRYAEAAAGPCKKRRKAVKGCPFLDALIPLVQFVVPALTAGLNALTAGLPTAGVGGVRRHAGAQKPGEGPPRRPTTVPAVGTLAVKVNARILRAPLTSWEESGADGQAGFWRRRQHAILRALLDRQRGCLCTAVS
jgi:hypothetical protein